MVGSCEHDNDTICFIKSGISYHLSNNQNFKEDWIQLIISTNFTSLSNWYKKEKSVFSECMFLPILILSAYNANFTNNQTAGRCAEFWVYLLLLCALKQGR
jgi:hypothetical protein